MHVVICPYTKVEESFNIQAIHDVLYSKWNIEEVFSMHFLCSANVYRTEPMITNLPTLTVSDQISQSHGLT